MPTQLGLGMAALGRPGYVTLNHARDLGARYDPQAMEAHSHAVLDAAFEEGIRYIDAARSYGKAEDFVATWLRKHAIKPGEVTVASKWGYTYTAGWSTSAAQHEIKDHSLASFERQLDESLERLGRHVSLYQIHSVTAESKTLDDDRLIDAIARLRERGISAGLSVSGPGQSVAIQGALEVRRDGSRVFDSVQATWNLLERGAEQALEDAHAAGMKVVVKEALANGRLTHGNQGVNAVFGSQLDRIRAVAEERGTTIEMLSLAAALSRPWATIVLTGAATVDQIRSTVAARDFSYDPGLEQELRTVCVSSEDYWRVRSRFSWN